MARAGRLWHRVGVIDDPVQRRLRCSLYAEAMLLADEARSYFEDAGPAESASLDPLTRVRFSCESLKVTTRIMHVVAWLLMRRAVDAGEIAPTEPRLPSRRLGASPEVDEVAYAAVPERARALIDASVDLHRRVQHLDRALDEEAVSPARLMQERLARSF